MKFICLQENLEKALSLINRTTTVKTQLPITTNVFLEVSKKGIELIGTDLENTVHVFVSGKPEKQGSILVPTRTFIETINALPKEQVVLETEELVLVIKAGKYEVRINGISGTEFPKPEQIDSKEKRTLTNILPSIKMIAFASATDESRAALTGVLLLFQKDEILLVATDGYRLSLKKISHKKGSAEEVERLIIPARMLGEIAKVASEEGKNGENGEENFLAVGGMKNQAAFLLGDVTISTRLIEGEFPLYEKIIPTSFQTQVVFDRDEFIKAVKLSSIFARDAANIVKFKISEKGITVSANAPQVGQNKCEVEANLKGDENEIAFNSRFLIEFLNAIDSKEITFEMTGPLSPGVFKIPGDDSYLHIIMPVRVQQ